MHLCKNKTDITRNACLERWERQLGYLGLTARGERSQTGVGFPDILPHHFNNQENTHYATQYFNVIIINLLNNTHWRWKKRR